MNKLTPNECEKLTVRPVEYRDTKPFILDIHYAKRMPSISFAYGLFDSDELIGVLTFGQPASPFLCRGVCGPDNRDYVIELNRLVLKYNKKNQASFFILKGLRLLPRPKIVVSYADTAQGHHGGVYRASNFLYTGATKPRTDIASASGGTQGITQGIEVKECSGPLSIVIFIS